VDAAFGRPQLDLDHRIRVEAGVLEGINEQLMHEEGDVVRALHRKVGCRLHYGTSRPETSFHPRR
jgi:hypothetical protein